MVDNKISIDIAMCTYRRDSVIDTLNSLQKLQLDNDWQVRIIVADNDAVPSAQQRVLSVDQTNIPVIYIHAPQSNISIARNACLSLSDSQWLAFIDDDELAMPGWLKALMQTATSTSAQVVLGPVDARYDPEFCEDWMSKGGFYQTRPVYVNGAILTGYTCNVLLDRRDERVKNADFDLALGKTGGEDTVLFSELYKQGCIIKYAQKAVLIEPITLPRASLKWLWLRRYRSGQTHGMLLADRVISLTDKLKQILIASVKASFCHIMLLLTLWNPVAWRRWWLRGGLHLGVVSSLLGKDTLVQYGEAKK
ncbi:glycosyltransferase family 2 protein [uncultured Amphritea sp.]|uniref:glycosyltransferase family 2 protein n=1 Tax=uncultured Amphritea sp. TaxID=981605 RepID=UPI0026071C7E|nr:glycosyltransferase family 2 protein [uncultured Amphritea sp.]